MTEHFGRFIAGGYRWAREAGASVIATGTESRGGPAAGGRSRTRIRLAGIGNLPAPRTRRFAVPAGIALAAMLPAATGAAAESWTVRSGEVRVQCRLTVGGSFEVVTSTISGSLRQEAPEAPGYSGALRVALDTLDSGIGLRNRHLRETYLEVDRGERFREAVLTELRLAEALPVGARDHETGFSGTLTLHGVERTIEGAAEIRRGGGEVRVEARFPLSLEDFEIAPPRYLGVGVRDSIRVVVTFEAAVGDLAGETRR